MNECMKVGIIDNHTKQNVDINIDELGEFGWVNYEGQK